MEILYLITARGGSKGVPKKNIKILGELPLIAYKIKSIQKSRFAGRIILSTDDEEIAKIGKEFGAEVPFLRPDYLATDTSSSVDVVIHAMDWIEQNENKKYDYLCLVEPSSPFATYEDYDNAIQELLDSNVDTLLSVKEVEVNKIFIHELTKDYKMDKFYEAILNLKNQRRQDFEKQYTMNGCIYIAKWDYLKERRMFHSINSKAYIMDEKYSVEIDTIDNFNYAEYLIKTNKIDLKYWKV